MDARTSPQEQLPIVNAPNWDVLRFYLFLLMNRERISHSRHRLIVICMLAAAAAASKLPSNELLLFVCIKHHWIWMPFGGMSFGCTISSNRAFSYMINFCGASNTHRLGYGMNRKLMIGETAMGWTMRPKLYNCSLTLTYLFFGCCCDCFGTDCFRLADIHVHTYLLPHNPILHQMFELNSQ